MFGKSPFDCGTCAMPMRSMSAGAQPWIPLPSRCISPRRGFSSPLIARSTVDLPAPFGPTMQATEPCSTSRSTPWSTSPPPYPATTPLRVSIASRLHRLLLDHEVVPEVGVEDLRVLLDLVRRALRHQLAAAQDPHRVAEPEHERHVVLHEQERLAAAVELADHLPHPLDQRRVDAAGRLV